MALSTSSPIPSGIPPDAFATDAPSSRRPYAPQSPNIMDDSRSSNSPHTSSKRPSGRGNTSQPGTPQNQQRSPNPTINSSGSASTARPTASQPSPRTPTVGSASQQARHEQPGVYDPQGGVPIVPPPRTSSTQRAASSAQPNTYSIPDRTRQRGEDQRGYDGSNVQIGETSDNASAGARERRNVTVSPAGAQRSTGTRERNQAQSPSVPRNTTSNSANARPGDFTRENSEVINRITVTDPQVDIAREQERLAEAAPAGTTPKSTGHGIEEETGASSAGPTRRSRQDFSASASKRKETRFGDYILGQTLGEGEFGKVKLGWKKDGSIEVAIKLLRRENLNTNPSRLPKIYREISILRSLSHPNIVGLHEMVETERHIGIIMEYASGGELFDYILTHRYLKDNAARRLFAQLVSGVGYLHKKGIVHRDLKLENLLLDRNRNIIITDFGFANTFDPRDTLAEETEYNLTNRDFVKKMDLERVVNGFRRGDLMQTSCGSPCYAAPELVVTDSLYTGRKVDVWSCGVILYAMLAGYLPFDDDPANPEGDNINLLYKYIVSTSLTFPEYVSPHARDLLRRILVPDPRKRADLFEVARHSWLSEYAHVVGDITSTTTTIGDITNTTIARDHTEAPMLNRSASVREPSKPHSTNISPVGGLTHQGKLDDQNEKARAPRDGKRRTVQVEYVAPQSQTIRGELSPPPSSQPASASRSPEASAARATQPHPSAETPQKPSSSGIAARKPLPQDPPSAEDARKVAAGYSASCQPGSQGLMEPPGRPSREPPRAVSDSTGAFAQFAPTSARPNTGGSMSSVGGRLPSRGNSYSQPLAPTVAATNAQGRLAQPQGTRNYKISNPIPQPEPYIATESAGNRPTSQRVPSRYSQSGSAAGTEGKGHRRASTLSNIFSRPGSIFGGKSQAQSSTEPAKPGKKYPPTSMKAPLPTAESPRQSTDSRRPSIGFSRKNSDLSRKEKPRRFSLLPASFSFKSMTGSTKDSDSGKHPQEQKPAMSQHSNYQGMAPGRSSHESQRYDASTERNRLVSAPLSRERPPKSAPHQTQQRFVSTQYPPNSNWESGSAGKPYNYGEPGSKESEASFSQQAQQSASLYPQGFNDYDTEPQPRQSMQNHRGARVLQKQNRKFTEAWEQEEPGHHSGSSGAARRVMDFFRRRGRARYGDDR